MSELLDLMRRVVREELKAQRGPLLATVTAVYAHEDKDDSRNYEADVRLKHDGLELKNVPMAVPHVGVAAPPRVGDLVLVQCIDQDLHQPLVTGRFYHDQERTPLFKEDEVLFEHRLPDGKINHLRFAADGTIYLQRDVSKPEDNSEFQAGMKIDPDGNIEIKTKGNVKVSCEEMTIDGKLTVIKATQIMDVKIDGTTIKGPG